MTKNINRYHNRYQSGGTQEEESWDYFEMDKKMEKVYPIDPLNEPKITDDEIKKRKARFYDYKRIWEWKRDKILWDIKTEEVIKERNKQLKLNI